MMYISLTGASLLVFWDFALIYDCIKLIFNLPLFLTFRAVFCKIPYLPTVKTFNLAIIILLLWVPLETLGLLLLMVGLVHLLTPGLHKLTVVIPKSVLAPLAHFHLEPVKE